MKVLAPTVALASALALPQPATAVCADPAQVVRGFLQEVRSGRNPEAASLYFAPVVLAHQVTSEGASTVSRTPADYASHVREFLAAFGAYEFTIEELIAADCKVFVRWRQVGKHLQSLDGEKPTGRSLVELTSVVYRVQEGLIREYWLQTDRKGLELQLERLRPAEKIGERAGAT